MIDCGPKIYERMEIKQILTEHVIWKELVKGHCATPGRVYTRLSAGAVNNILKRHYCQRDKQLDDRV